MENEAYRTRAELHGLDAAESAARAEASVARATYLPTVGAFANLKLAPTDGSVGQASRDAINHESSLAMHDVIIIGEAMPALRLRCSWFAPVEAYISP